MSDAKNSDYAGGGVYTLTDGFLRLRCRLIECENIRNLFSAVLAQALDDIKMGARLLASPGPISAGSAAEDASDAIDWVFSDTPPTEDKLTFLQCCEAVDMDAESIRASVRKVLQDAKREAENGPRVFSTADAAQRMGICAATLAKWRAKGNGPTFSRVAGRVVYDPADVDAWIAANGWADGVLTHRQAAFALGVRDDTLRGWRARGYGPAFKTIGGQIGYLQRDIDAFLAECRVGCRPKGEGG